ncbi:hypothetical protein TSUD_387560 [Trifolium subterraneum]|uniref:Uncharacterized protein n=1 Tax=Trifolium subterraneum TaxID=3900 RepID=A0A2Z6MVC4_TRISU|nr:hypothetical protein TSUD_387560 [Trifolium subterraneum]
MGCGLVNSDRKKIYLKLFEEIKAKGEENYDGKHGNNRHGKKNKYGGKHDKKNKFGGKHGKRDKYGGR